MEREFDMKQSGQRLGPTTYVACPQCSKINRVSIEKARSSTVDCGACRAHLDVRGTVQSVATHALNALVAKSPLPVVVDFWAPWCAPCRSFAPTFESVANELAGRAVFVKLDTQANEQAAMTYGIRGIPTLAIFHQGKELARESGALPHAQFKSFALASIGSGAR